MSVTTVIGSNCPNSISVQNNSPITDQIPPSLKTLTILEKNLHNPSNKPPIQVTNTIHPQYPTKSLHQRQKEYFEAKKRIFNESLEPFVKEILTEPNNSRIHKCRERYIQRKYIRNCIKNAEVSSNLDNRVHLKVQLNNLELYGLLDSGCTITCLGKNSESFLKQLNITPYPVHGHVKTAGGQPLEIIGQVKVKVKYSNRIVEMKILVIPRLQQELYLGVDFWREFDLAPHIISEITSEEPLDIEQHLLTLTQRKSLDSTILKFPSSATMGLGQTHLETHNIDTGDSNPIRFSYKDQSSYRQKLIDTEIKRMLELKVIEPSNSPWCNPIMLKITPKKIRLCLDARRLNAVTKHDAYPLPHINPFRTLFLNAGIKIFNVGF